MSLTTDLGARNGRLALICATVFVAMVAAAFAAVPFYRAFCQATGYNGTVRRATAATASTPVAAGTVSVRFDTNVNGIAWRFEPEQASQVTHFGEHRLAFFRATNTSNHTLTGRAVYNVTPETAGQYFSKLECFCFKNQTLAPGQSAEFPVVYTVDPRYAHDRDTQGQTEITLSYTFFPAVGSKAGTSATQANVPTPSGLGGTARARL